MFQAVKACMCVFSLLHVPRDITKPHLCIMYQPVVVCFTQPFYVIHNSSGLHKSHNKNLSGWYAIILWGALLCHTHIVHHTYTINTGGVGICPGKKRPIGIWWFDGASFFSAAYKCNVYMFTYKKTNLDPMEVWSIQNVICNKSAILLKSEEHLEKMSVFPRALSYFYCYAAFTFNLLYKFLASFNNLTD